jgi:uncharacterized protein YebE (UPF0316 family)
MVSDNIFHTSLTLILFLIAILYCTADIRKILAFKAHRYLTIKHFPCSYFVQSIIERMLERSDQAFG